MSYHSFRVTIKARGQSAILSRSQTMFEDEATDLGDLIGTLVDAIHRARAVSMPPPGPVNSALQRGLFIQTLLQSLLGHAAARLAMLTDEAERTAPDVEKLRASMAALERAAPVKPRRATLQ
jgi:hypothetical protein